MPSTMMTKEPRLREKIASELIQSTVETGESVHTTCKYF